MYKTFKSSSKQKSLQMCYWSSKEISQAVKAVDPGLKTPDMPADSQ